MYLRNTDVSRLMNEETEQHEALARANDKARRYEVLRRICPNEEKKTDYNKKFTHYRGAALAKRARLQVIHNQLNKELDNESITF